MLPALVLLSLVAVPALAGLLAFAIRADGPRRFLLVATALAHGGLTAWAWMVRPSPILGEWIGLDGPGLFFLAVTSALFLAAAVYGVGFLRREASSAPAGEHGGGVSAVLGNASEAVFTGCLLLFLATMSLVTLSHHFGLLWVAVEATTLASAPLIYYHRHTRSLEATWKYLLVCSVGIALALLGNFFLAVAASKPSGDRIPLILSELLGEGRALHLPWLKAAFLLFLVGYGTKMGLAPLHTWLPDAHSEAPSVVSALLSGALLNCAFLGILRAEQVCIAAGQAPFAQDLLVVFGLLSMGVAGVFILGQPDYKRLLAYSSVEHMGILSLGVGLGGAGAAGSFLHALNHSLAKAMLFFVAGNILAAYGTKTVANVRGLVRTMPATGILWVAGFLAITGSPPFGLFLSEVTILKAALDDGRILVAVLYLLFLALIFVGMASVFLRMAQGSPPKPIGTAEPIGTAMPIGTAEPRTPRESFLCVFPPAVFCVLVLVLGLYVPPGLKEAIEAAARVVGGGR